MYPLIISDDAVAVKKTATCFVVFGVVMALFEIFIALALDEIQLAFSIFLLLLGVLAPWRRTLLDKEQQALIIEDWFRNWRWRQRTIPFSAVEQWILFHGLSGKRDYYAYMRIKGKRMVLRLWPTKVDAIHLYFEQANVILPCGIVKENIFSWLRSKFKRP